MRSETIFKFTARWRTRYGSHQAREIAISSCFDNPGQWPFTLKRYDIFVNSFDYSEDKQEYETVRISAETFEEIKRYIENNAALKACPENIENNVMDGSMESFYFACNSYTKRTGGMSVLGSGHYGSANSTVCSAIEGIGAILAKSGIELGLY